MITVGSILQAKGNNIYSITSDQSVFDALLYMGEKNIGALLILDGEELKGIFSERDYARKIVLKSKSSRETLVSEIMTELVITVNSSDSIEQCMAVMSEKRIRHLPVLEGKKIVGVISIGDVVHAIIESQKETISHLRTYIGQ